MLCLDKPVRGEHEPIWVSGSSPANSCSTPSSHPASVPIPQRSSSSVSRCLSLSLQPLDEDAPWTEPQPSSNSAVNKSAWATDFAIRSSGPITWGHAAHTPSLLDLRPKTEEECRWHDRSPFMQAAQPPSSMLLPEMLPAIITARRTSPSALDSPSPSSSAILNRSHYPTSLEQITSHFLTSPGRASDAFHGPAAQPHSSLSLDCTRGVHSLDSFLAADVHQQGIVRSASACNLHMQQLEDCVRGGRPRGAHASMRDMKTHGGRVPSREQLDMAGSPVSIVSASSGLEKMARSASYIPMNSSALSLSSVEAAMPVRAAPHALGLNSAGSCSSLSFDCKVHKGLLGEEQRVHGGTLKNSPSRHALGSQEMGLLGSHDSTPGLLDDAHLTGSLALGRGVSADARELEGMLDSLWTSLVPQVQAHFLDSAASVDESMHDDQASCNSTVQVLAPSASLGHVYKVRPGSAKGSTTTSPLGGTQPYSHFSSGSHTALLDLLLAGFGGPANTLPAPSVARGTHVGEAGGAEASPAGSASSLPTLLAYAERASGRHRTLQHQPHTALPASCEAMLAAQVAPKPAPTRAASTSQLVRGSMV